MVLILGDGLLGSEIEKQTDWKCISRKKNGFDISRIEDFSHLIDGHNTIVNCIAHTDTYSLDREKHWSVNCNFVKDLILYCNKHSIKLVHISTDYVYAGSKQNASEEDVPVHCCNWYGYTKNLADGLVQLLATDYLICRCTHKKNPFPYESAWINQISNTDYVDVISKLIIELIKKEASGVFNVGTEIKTMQQLASKTRSVSSILAPDKVPKDTSMNVLKMVQYLNL